MSDKTRIPNAEIDGIRGFVDDTLRDVMAERDKAVKVADAMREIVEELREKQRLRPRDEDPKGIALCLYENGTSRWWEPDLYWPVDERWINERTGVRVLGWVPLPPTDLEVTG